MKKHNFRSNPQKVASNSITSTSTTTKEMLDMDKEILDYEGSLVKLFSAKDTL